MTFQVEVYDDAVAYSSAVRPFLEEHEAENGLFLGVLTPGGRPLMARAAADGRTVFAAFYREINLIVTRGPDEAVEAAAAAIEIDLPGVVGPAREAERFASAWANRRGCDSFLAVDQRIYRLTEAVPPAPVSGGMRPVVAADLDLVSGWAHAFDLEAIPHEAHGPEEARARMSRRIAEGMMFGWEADGRLVSMAGLARPTRRTISVNSVFTPPAERRSGFATSLVAALSAEGLRRGKEACVLYTDLSNPTSNSIYAKIGYRPVCDSRNYRFRPRAV